MGRPRLSHATSTPKRQRFADPPNLTDKGVYHRRVSPETPTEVEMSGMGFRYEATPVAEVVS